MTIKILIFTFLLTIEFVCIKTEQQISHDYSLWPKKSHNFEMKEIQATFRKETLPKFKESLRSAGEKEKELSLEKINMKKSHENLMETIRREGMLLSAGEQDEVSSRVQMVSLDGTKQINSDVEQLKTNRIKKREIVIDSEEYYDSSSIESSEIRKERAEIEIPNHEIIWKHPIKRQTSITGNGNRLSNLINLPVRLNVLANVLSQLNQGVLDSKKEKPLGSTTIKGNDNTISNLINAPIDVDAVVNLLSQVDTTKSGGGSGSSKGGVVGGLLGGLLGGRGGGGGGGEAGKSNKGLVGGLLHGVLGDGNGSGLLGGLLGNTLGDLLGALLGDDGLVGNLLGGADGKGLVTNLLNNLLGGVADLVDNLLELLLGILDGLLAGLANSSHSADSQGAKNEGNHNQVSPLVNSPVRVEALINALTSLQQELRQQLEPTAGSNKGTNIKGNNNQVSSLLNLPLDLNLDLNLLSSSNGTKHAKSIAPGTSLLGSGPPKASSSSLVGSLLGSSLPVLPVPGSAPDGSTLQGSLLGPASPASSVSSLVGSLLGSASGEAHSSAGSSVAETSSSLNSASSTIQGDNNVISSLLNVVPDVNLHLNLLSELTELLVGNDDGNGVHDSSKPNEICFDIPISEADTTVTGNNNKISSAINIKPKINLDLNLLSKAKETGGSKGPTQRVCIIRPNQPLADDTRAPAPPSTTTPKNTLPKTTPPKTAPPNIAPPMTAPPKSAPPKTLPPKTTPHTIVAPKNAPFISSHEICFNVWIDQPGNIVSGNDNQLTSLINVEPTINVGLNLLSNVQQTNFIPANLAMKRICIPAAAAANTPQFPSPIHSPTEVLISPHHLESHSFRKPCTQWDQFYDYNCLNNPNEYSQYTREIYNI